MFISGTKTSKKADPEEAVLGTERCGDENCLSIPNCVDERCAGSGERPTNRFIGGGKEGDRSAL